jgi:ribosome-binding ATPase YchF (GTP1/OBG family)
VVDIAGLVKGASAGEGLGEPPTSPFRCGRSASHAACSRRGRAGNAFLSHIRAVDGIFHVRCRRDAQALR